MGASLVTVTVEVPPATSSTLTSVTAGISFSSLLTALTQWPQVMPLTGKVWVLIGVSFGVADRWLGFMTGPAGRWRRMPRRASRHGHRGRRQRGPGSGAGGRRGAPA